jgi:hypothetical protein
MALLDRPEYIQPSDVRPGDIIHSQRSVVVPESRHGFQGTARVRFSAPITLERIHDCHNGRSWPSPTASSPAERPSRPDRGRNECRAGGDEPMSTRHPRALPACRPRPRHHPRTRAGHHHRRPGEAAGTYQAAVRGRRREVSRRDRVRCVGERGWAGRRCRDRRHRPGILDTTGGTRPTSRSVGCRSSWTTSPMQTRTPRPGNAKRLVAPGGPVAGVL